MFDSKLLSIIDTTFHPFFIQYDIADGEYESDHEDEELFELESRMSTP